MRFERAERKKNDLNRHSSSDREDHLHHLLPSQRDMRDPQWVSKQLVMLLSLFFSSSALSALITLKFTRILTDSLHAIELILMTSSSCCRVSIALAYVHIRTVSDGERQSCGRFRWVRLLVRWRVTECNYSSVFFCSLTNCLVDHG